MHSAKVQKTTHFRDVQYLTFNLCFQSLNENQRFVSLWKLRFLHQGFAKTYVILPFCICILNSVTTPHVLIYFVGSMYQSDAFQVAQDDPEILLSKHSFEKIGNPTSEIRGIRQRITLAFSIKTTMFLGIPQMRRTNIHKQEEERQLSNALSGWATLAH